MDDMRDRAMTETNCDFSFSESGAKIVSLLITGLFDQKQRHYGSKLDTGLRLPAGKTNSLKHLQSEE